MGGVGVLSNYIGVTFFIFLFFATFSRCILCLSFLLHSSHLHLFLLILGTSTSIPQSIHWIVFVPFSKSSINQPWHYTALGQSGETTLAIRHFYLFILVHLTKSPQTLVKWAFQAYIYITSVQKTAIFKHFLRIFATHSVG